MEKEKIRKAQLQFVAPGDLLATEDEFDAGEGTYANAGDMSIRASLIGTVSVRPSRTPGKKGTLVVTREGSIRSIAVPVVDALVTCRITRISHLQANADILLLNGTPVEEPFHAVIRKENVRESEIDKVGLRTWSGN